jgi:hypothetical protein
MNLRVALSSPSSEILKQRGADLRKALVYVGFGSSSL